MLTIAVLVALQIVAVVVFAAKPRPGRACVVIVITLALWLTA